MARTAGPEAFLEATHHGTVSCHFKIREDLEGREEAYRTEKNYVFVFCFVFCFFFNTCPLPQILTFCANEIWFGQVQKHFSFLMKLTEDKA